MDIRKTLEEFKKTLDPKIEAYLDSAIQEAGKHDRFVADALRAVEEIALSGGKRLRAAFLYYAYLAAGGTDRKRILKTSMSVELIHLFLLIHDDIMDRDTVRHGVPTIHERYRAIAKRYFPETDAEHFGNSIAIIIGDMLGAFGNDIIFRSGFPNERVFRALSKLQEIVSYTVIGQAKDVYFEYRKKASRDDILKMYEYKTAKYTLEGPIALGFLLAGGKPALLKKFERYALPIGIAFQIQDDILGVFGSPERTGKSSASDLREGKMTLLVATLIERLSRSDAKYASELLRKGAALTDADAEWFRRKLLETGALEEVRSIANDSIETGMKALRILEKEIPRESYEFFSGVAEYMAKREC